MKPDKKLLERAEGSVVHALALDAGSALIGLAPGGRSRCGPLGGLFCSLKLEGSRPGGIRWLYSRRGSPSF